MPKNGKEIIMENIKKSALELFVENAALNVDVDVVRELLATADTEKDAVKVDAIVSDVKESLDKINAHREAELAIAILSESESSAAWEVYLSSGTYKPYKLTTKTVKGVTTRSIVVGEDVIVRPTALFDAYKEKHGITMTSEGYMSRVIDFYWAFVSSKAGDLGAAPLKLKEKYSDRPASGNDLEKLMNAAAQALYAGMSFKLYRKNLIALNDYVVKGTVFKAKIGGENKVVDALIRCMIMQKADRQIAMDVRGKCIDRG